MELLHLFRRCRRTAIGSGYYHLHPNNETLVWDRLPMAIGFLALLAAILCERLIFHEMLRHFLFLLPIAGAPTVFYWQATERHGNGDLRPTPSPNSERSSQSYWF